MFIKKRKVTFSAIAFKLPESHIAGTESTGFQELTNKIEPPEHYSCSTVSLWNHYHAH